MVVRSVYEYYQIRSGVGKYAWRNAPDVNVIEGPCVTPNQNNWKFDVTSQHGADLTIELGPKTWGLHPTEISHYHIQIKGETHTIHDGQLLIVVSSGNYYFVQLKSLDTTSRQYQECPRSNSPLLEQNVSKMINSAKPDRYHRFCNNDDWNEHGFEKTTIWPIGFFLYSNPLDNTLNYSWYHDFFNDESIDVSSYYTSTFPANQGLKIHISGRELGHRFTINRINLYYQTLPTTGNFIIRPKSTSIEIQTTKTNMLIYGLVFVSLIMAWICTSTTMRLRALHIITLLINNSCKKCPFKHSKRYL